MARPRRNPLYSVMLVVGEGIKPSRFSQSDQSRELIRPRPLNQSYPPITVMVEICLEILREREFVRCLFWTNEGQRA